MEKICEKSASAVENQWPGAPQMWKLETNLDDCTGEALGYTMEKLLEAGAADVWYQPIYMKKNRPAVMLCVLCRLEQKECLERIIFENTTTIGIRYQPVWRDTLQRRLEQRRPATVRFRRRSVNWREGCGSIRSMRISAESVKPPVWDMSRCVRRSRRI